MLYIVTWPPGKDGPPRKSKFATWDGKVVDATPAVRWAVGKHFESAASILRDHYGAVVHLVPGSHNINSV